MGVMQAKLIAILFLLFMAVAIGYSIRSYSQDRHSKYNLIDLLLDDKGKASGRAHVMFGAFAVSTWMMIYLTMRDLMDVEYMLVYLGAWVAPTLTKFAFHRPGPPVGE